jgi:hypothetical protein
MSLARRSFLSGILAAGVSPALCKAGFLMPVKKLMATPREISISCRWEPESIGSLDLLDPRYSEAIYRIMLEEDRHWLASSEL